MNVRTNDMGFPYPMGKIYPGANFAVLSVPLTQNITPVENDGMTPDKRFNGIYIQASPGNVADIYVCNDANPPNLVDYSNVLGVLTAGQWFPRVKEWGNNRDITKLFIGAVNATDFVIACIDQD